MGKLRVTPWTDYAGNPIKEGDLIQHPDGGVGQVYFDPHISPLCINKWRVAYNAEGDDNSCLYLQIGGRGQAVVIATHSDDKEEKGEGMRYEADSQCRNEKCPYHNRWCPLLACNMYGTVDIKRGDCPDYTPASSEDSSAFDSQVGGGHYKQYQIQPYEFFYKNNIPHHKSAIIRRILRYDSPSGKGEEDLDKIAHEVELIKEMRQKEDPDV